MDADRPWMVPRLSCEVCQRGWVEAGESYPCVDLAGHEIMHALKPGGVVSRVEHESIRAALRPLVSPKALLLPGAGLGPLHGTIRGTLTDFVSPLGDTWLVREETVNAMALDGIRWPQVCPARLKVVGKTGPVRLLDLQPLPVVSLQIWRSTPGERTCPACGGTFGRKRAPELLAYYADTVPDDCDVFRVRNWTSQVVVTERFRHAALELGVTGVSFKPVPPKTQARNKVKS